jgi:hypothetical protein
MEVQHQLNLFSYKYSQFPFDKVNGSHILFPQATWLFVFA